MAIKVLIVDDEVKVCNLIKSLIDWEKLGLTIIGVANDGEGAFQMVRELSPDIIITDIRMPGYSGIEFIQKVRETNEGVHFIIVSGYRQFEYANQAIKFGVEDYLLKPLKKTEIEKILTKIVSRHNENLERAQKQEYIENQMTQTSAQLRDYFIQLLTDSEKWTRMRLSEQTANESYHLNLHLSAYRVMLIQALVRDDPLRSTANGALLKKIRRILENHLEHESLLAVVGISDDYVYCLINDAPERLELLRGVMRRALCEFSSIKDIFGSFDVTLAISGVAMRFEDLPEAVEQARAAYMQRFFIPEETIIEFSAAFLPPLNSPDTFDSHFKLHFRKYMTTLEEDCVKDGFEEAYDVLRECYPSGALFYGAVDKMIGMFLDIMDENGVALPASFRGDCRMRLRAARSVREVISELEEMCVARLNVWKAEKNEEIVRPIRKAMSFIQEYYNDQLTLNSVSAEVGLSPSYLSTVFKRETGKSFVDYLTEVRIDAAKEFLIKTDLGIADIVERVGYNDTKYFYKRFKQAVGVSLQEYRRLYSWQR